MNSEMVEVGVEVMFNIYKYLLVWYFRLYYRPSWNYNIMNIL